MTAGNSRQAIRKAIAATGWSQEEAAAQLKMSPVTLSRWLNGKSDPSFAKLDKLANLLGQPLILTFGSEHEEAPPIWAERLLAGIFALETKGEVTDEELAQAQARVAAFLAVTRQGLPLQAGGGGAALADA